MRRLVFQPEADADLAHIWNFSAGRWSVAQADAYTTRLVEALGALPERSPKAKPYSDIYPDFRVFDMARTWCSSSATRRR